MAKAYDPVMHTAEHVLNGVMVRRFGCARCFSTHINSGKSKVDFRFPRDLSGEEARAVEAEVNAELAEGHAVTARFMPREEAARRVNLSRLPESAGENLRIVYVGDPDSPVDACPCIGEHVENTLRCGRFAWCSHDFTPPREGGKGGRSAGALPGGSRVTPAAEHSAAGNSLRPGRRKAACPPRRHQPHFIKSSLSATSPFREGQSARPPRSPSEDGATAD